MCAKKGGIVLIVFCGLLVALCWQTPARAASAPPAIGDIVGTYVVTDKEVYYDFSKSIPVKENYVLTWRISPDSPTTVQVKIEGDYWETWTFKAYYKNGYLIQSCGDITTGPEYWGALGVAFFSGKQGKVKFKGDFGWGQFGGVDEYCEWDPFSGKMVSTDPGFVVGATSASRGDEQAVSVPGEGTVPLAAVTPLSIDDLPGPYSCTLTGTLYHPTAGTKEKGKLSDFLTISKIDNNTLNIDSPEWNVKAHYGSGILMVADVDVDVLDPSASFAIVVAKGKPGKISLTGKILSVTNLGTPDDEFEVAKVSCKQSLP